MLHRQGGFTPTSGQQQQLVVSRAVDVDRKHFIILLEDCHIILWLAANPMPPQFERPINLVLCHVEHKTVV